MRHFWHLTGSLPALLLWLCLVVCLLLIGTFRPAYGQPVSTDTTSVFQLDSLPAQGYLLYKGWKWHPGDNMAWANTAFDDRQWYAVNPITDIHYLPQVRQAQIGWFRLRLRVGPALRHKSLALVVGQMGASELYLNGRLVQRFGVVSANPDLEQTYNPKNRPITLVLGEQAEQVLAVRYSFTRQNPYLKYGKLTGSSCFSAWLTEVESAWAWFVGWHDYLIPPIALYGGLYLMLTLLHGFFYIAYPPQKANGYFAAYAFFQCVAIGSDASYLLTHSAGWAFTGIMLNKLSSLLAHACMLQAVYLFFKKPIGVAFGSAIVILLVSVFLPFLAYERGWDVGFTGSVIFINLDILRVSWLAIRQQQPDARLLFGGQIIVLVAYWPIVLMIMAPNSAFHQQLAFWIGPVYPTLYLIWVLTLPITFSFALARQFARLNQILEKKLVEVDDLSQKNVAHEAEKRQILITQNETLERQVAERTTELIHQAKELRVAQDQLRAVSERKEHFFSNIAHEFRTPLTLILAPVEKLLHQLRADESARRLLLTVQRNAGQLLTLVNQLLDLAKLEDGRLVAAPKLGNLVGFVGERLEPFLELAGSRGLTLHFAAKDLPNATVFDAEKVGKIVDNLLSNALKFTPAGGNVTVAVEWIVERSSAILRVTDTGIGIPANKLPHVFDRFYQADDSHTRGYEGTGIGLALMKQLTEWLGGTVTVTSEEGRGTTFTVELPVQLAEVHESSRLPSQKEPLVLPVVDKVTTLSNGTTSNGHLANETQPLLMVVEDNDELRDFLAESLAVNFRVLTAVDGREGLFVAQRELPDVVISDVMMPAMDGYQLCRHLKTDSQTDHIAVLLLTARSTHESRMEGLSTGADDYLTKPFHPDELHLRLRNLLTRRARLQAYFQRQLAQPVSVLTDPVLVFATPDATTPFLKELYAHIEARLDDSAFGAEELAAAVSMSRRNLHRKLAALVGLPPQEIIRRYRLRRATELLRAGRNVSETAYLIGYESPAHFAAIFKEFYGQTPSKFIQ